MPTRCLPPIAPATTAADARSSNVFAVSESPTPRPEAQSANLYGFGRLHYTTSQEDY